MTTETGTLTASAASITLNTSWPRHRTERDRLSGYVSNGGIITAFDVETKTTGERFKYPNGTESNHPVGLDPRVSQVTTFTAVSSDGTVVQADGEERSVLEVARTVVQDKSRLLVGWNSLFFDLAFMKVRGVIAPPYTATPFDFKFYGPSEDDPEPKYGFPEWGHLVTDSGKWGSVTIPHVDIAPLFKAYAEKKGIKHSLKPVAESFGIGMISVDTGNMQDLTLSQRLAYCLSDSTGVLELVNVVINGGHL